MRHHIERLLLLEQQLNEQLQDAFHRQTIHKVATAIQLPYFQQVSIVRQLLAECASVHIGLYEPIERQKMCARIEVLRHLLHVEQQQDVTGFIDALCYFEQYYDDEDARHNIDDAAHNDLKWVIAYTLSWLDEPQSWSMLQRSLVNVAEAFAVHYRTNDFTMSAKRALADLIDIDQLVMIHVDAQQNARYTFVPSRERLNQLLRRVYHTLDTSVLLSASWQQQIRKLYNEQLMTPQ